MASRTPRLARPAAALLLAGSALLALGGPATAAADPTAGTGRPTASAAPAEQTHTDGTGVTDLAASDPLAGVPARQGAPTPPNGDGDDGLPRTGLDEPLALAVTGVTFLGLGAIAVAVTAGKIRKSEE